MWYVIQTITGKEEELAKTVRTNLPPSLCEDCFSVKRRLLKRLGGEWLPVTETLFPSYVFVETDSPEQLFYKLKKIPEYTKLLGSEESGFLPLEKEEEDFLKKICHREENGFMAELTDVYLGETGEIRKAEGPLRFFFRQNCKIEPEKTICSDRADDSGQETDRCVRNQVEERRASGMRLFFVWRENKGGTEDEGAIFTA